MAKANPRLMLITFGAGSMGWRAAARRLGRQAAQSGRFSLISVNTERSLKRDHPLFYAENHALLKPEVRGFGYWIWKPYLIDYALRTYSHDADAVLFLDGGCEINSKEESQFRWEEYLSLIMEPPGRLAMVMNQHVEKVWSKSDTMTSIGLDQEGANSGQIMATAVAFRISDKNVQLTSEWLKLCLVDGYHLVDDTPSRIPNDPAFREHRHDQSILSALLKRNGTHVIPDETYWSPNWESAGSSFPIWTTRNGTGVSVMDHSFRGRLLLEFYRLNQLYLRFKKAKQIHGIARSLLKAKSVMLSKG